MLHIKAPSGDDNVSRIIVDVGVFLANPLLDMDPTIPNPAENPSQAVVELSQWRLKNSDGEFDDKQYCENLDTFMEDFNASFSAVVEQI